MEANVADPFGLYNILAFGDLQLVDEKGGTGAGDVIAFRAGFPTPLGRIIPHLLELEWDQILADGPLRSLSREVFFLLIPGEVGRGRQYDGNTVLC